MPRAVAPVKDAHLVLSDFARPQLLVPPLHLDQVEVAVDLDDAVDLLDDALRLVAGEREGLADEEAAGF